MSLSANLYTSAECFDRENEEDGTITPGLKSNDSNMEPLHRRNCGNNPTAPPKILENSR